MSATVFDLVHDELAHLARKDRTKLLPVPFSIDIPPSPADRWFKLKHPDLGEIPLTLFEIGHVAQLLDTRMKRADPREFVVQQGSTFVAIHRNARGVRFLVDNKRVHLGRAEAAALADALHHIASRCANRPAWVTPDGRIL